MTGWGEQQRRPDYGPPEYGGPEPAAPQYGTPGYGVPGQGAAQYGTPPYEAPQQYATGPQQYATGPQQYGAAPQPPPQYGGSQYGGPRPPTPAYGLSDLQRPQEPVSPYGGSRPPTPAYGLSDLQRPQEPVSPYGGSRPPTPAYGLSDFGMSEQARRPEYGMPAPPPPPPPPPPELPRRPDYGMSEPLRNPGYGAPEQAPGRVPPSPQARVQHDPTMMMPGSRLDDPRESRQQWSPGPPPGAPPQWELPAGDPGRTGMMSRADSGPMMSRADSGPMMSRADSGPMRAVADNGPSRRIPQRPRPRDRASVPAAPPPRQAPKSKVRPPLLVRTTIVVALIAALAASVSRADNQAANGGGTGTDETQTGNLQLATSAAGQSLKNRSSDAASRSRNDNATAPVTQAPADAADPTQGTPTAAAGGPATAPCRVSYSVVPETAARFTVVMVIENTSTKKVSGWTLRWTYPPEQKIVYAWNATVSNGKAGASATGIGNDQVIATGSNVTIGFVGKRGKWIPTPTDFALNGNACQWQPTTVADTPAATP